MSTAASVVERAGVERPCRHPRANHPHGSYLRHDSDGCKCTPCVTASRRHAKGVAYRTATGASSYVDARSAREHVRGLLRTLTVGQVEQRSGVNRTAIRVLVGDFPGRPASRCVTRKAAAALLAVQAERLGPERHGLVDATGTRRRLRALVALGWPARYLTQRLGTSSRTTSQLLLRTDPGAVVNVRTREAVTALYDELSMSVPQLSGGVTTARRRAAQRGWAPPLAWDDDAIDDPKASEPHPAEGPDLNGEEVIDEVSLARVRAGEPVRLSRAERRTVLAELVEQGLSDAEVAARVGVHERTVERDRRALALASRWVAA